MSDSQANMTLEVSNPSGRRLTLRRIEYELSHGDIGFPLTQGVWEGEVELPKKGRGEAVVTFLFDTTPIEEDSTLLHVNGHLYLTDHTGFLGISSLDLTESPFQVDIEAKRVEP